MIKFIEQSGVDLIFSFDDEKVTFKEVSPYNYQSNGNQVLPSLETAFTALALRNAMPVGSFSVSSIAFATTEEFIKTEQKMVDIQDATIRFSYINTSDKQAGINALLNAIKAAPFKTPFTAQLSLEEVSYNSFFGSFGGTILMESGEGNPRPYRYRSLFSSSVSKKGKLNSFRLGFEEENHSLRPTLSGLLHDASLDTISSLLPEKIRDIEISDTFVDFNLADESLVMDSKSVMFGGESSITMTYAWYNNKQSLQFYASLASPLTHSLTTLLNDLKIGTADLPLEYLPLADAEAGLKHISLDTVDKSFTIGARVRTKANGPYADVSIDVTADDSAGALSFQYDSPDDNNNNSITLGQALNSLLNGDLKAEISRLTDTDSNDGFISTLLSTSIQLFNLTVSFQTGDKTSVSVFLNSEFTLLDEPMGILVDLRNLGSKPTARISLGNEAAKGLSIPQVLKKLNINLGFGEKFLPTSKLAIHNLTVDTAMTRFNLSARFSNGFIEKKELSAYSLLCDMTISKTTHGFNISAFLDSSESPLTLAALIKDLRFDSYLPELGDTNSIVLSRASVEYDAEQKSVTLSCATDVSIGSFIKTFAGVDELPPNLPQNLRINIFELVIFKSKDISIEAEVEVSGDNSKLKLVDGTEFPVAKMEFSLEHKCA